MDKKTIFITGAASGIGLATAKLYADKGYYVGLFDINEAGLKEAQISIGASKSFYRTLDVTNFESVKVAMEEFMNETNGQLNILLANAGILYMGNYENGPLELYKKIIDVNTYGILAQINAALPYLKKTKRSSIIVTSSASSITGIPFFAVYSGTKHFTTGLVDALNLEFEKYDIFVGDVLPSFTKTKMVDTAVEQGADATKLTLLTPEAIALAIYNLEYNRKKIHVVVGEFKTLAIAKKLTGQLTLRKMVKKQIYNLLNPMYNK